MTIIQYGYILPRDYPVPWDINYSDIDDWWMWDICKFKPTVFPFDDKGNLKLDRKFGDKTKYYAELDLHMETYGLCPIQLDEIDNKNYVLGLWETCYNCEYSYLELEKDELIISETQRKELGDFCNVHNIKVEGKPTWFLINYDGG